jgi:protein MpaA
MRTFRFGTTVQELPIMAHRWHAHGPEVLIIGGVHGDEPEGIIAAQYLLGHFANSFPFRLNLTLVPCLNVDGFIARTRVNARAIDLNRNLPTNDWNPQAFNNRYHPGKFANSEPENHALVQYLAHHKPRWILSLHSWEPVLNVNGRCRKEAEIIAAHTNYAITEDIGYPTPGCLGTYAGLERDMPTLTYEIERGSTAQKIHRLHVPAIIEALKFVEKERPEHD